MEVGVVGSLTLIKRIKDSLDYCDIVINDIPYKMFGSYNESLQFVNRRVYFDTRPDMYEGRLIEVIANIVEYQVVQTVPEEKGVKLIPDNKDVRPICNYALDSIKIGDRLDDVIVYLSEYSIDSSDKAKWYDFKVVDMKSKVYSVRYFSRNQGVGVDEEGIIQNLTGKYVTLYKLAYTKYGLQVNGDDAHPAVRLYPCDVISPPEVAVAISIIEDMTKEDTELCAYMDKYNYINSLKSVIDVEPGFHLVRVATELVIIKMLTNVTNIYTERTLVRAAICARGYLIDRKNELSKPILNVNKISRTQLVSDIELINCIDVMSVSTSPVKRIYIEVAKFANFIVDERRGLIDEKEIMSRNSVISNQYGRLL